MCAQPDLKRSDGARARPRAAGSAAEGACAYADADLRDPARIINAASGLLDFRQPIAVMMIGILHLLPDADDPHGLVAALLDAVPSGSWLAIVHPALDIAADQMSEMADRFNRRVSTRATLRTHAEILPFFDGLELLDPGLVQLHRWRPGQAEVVTDDEVAAYCGLARKPL
jgi:hypothetical protein